MFIVNCELVIVRYGEIGLKAKATRRRFENVLVSNIKNALEAENVSNQIKLKRGRIFVYTERIDKSIFALKKVMGITSVSPAIKTDSKIESMQKLAVDISKKEIKETDSFALRVNREGNHKYTSQDVAVSVGEEVRKVTKAKVNLSKPDFTIFIEIRDDDAYFYKEKIPGVGGLPIGTQGNALSFIDSDKSILASWYMLHRGCKIVFMTENKNFNKNIEEFTKKWYASSPIFFFSKDEKFFENINKKAIDNKCEAVVTGHNIEDMYEIKLFKEKIKIPVLHPLVAMDKKQIENKSKEIGLQK